VTQFDPQTGTVAFEFVGSNAGSLASQAATVPPTSLGLTAMSPVESGVTPSPDQGGLSTGAIIGIAIGSAVALIAVIAAVVVAKRRRARSTTAEFSTYMGFESPIAPNDPNVDMSADGSIEYRAAPSSPSAPAVPDSDSQLRNDVMFESEYDVELAPRPPQPSRNFQDILDNL
jgi:hypothetical protein